MWPNTWLPPLRRAVTTPRIWLMSLGSPRAGLYKALSKDGNPSFDTIVKAMRVLGVRLVPQLTTSS